VLRLATFDDLDMIRAWRNHVQVRRASFTTHEISAEEHIAWFTRVAADPTRRVLVFARGGVPAGVVTIADLDADVAVWGYYLDVDGLTERGELMPAWVELERDTVEYAFDELGVARLGGETLAWNTAVLALHKRIGFSETRRYDRNVDGLPQEVVWTEMAAADRRRRPARSAPAAPR
jgi:UDP-4-amino-4,6-dideoxy-N-acetyl-beta-L-altrosamine N-acetyltransferase